MRAASNLAGVVGRAAQVIIKNGLQNNRELSEKVAKALVKSKLYEKAGELFELIGDRSTALETYKQGNHFRQALALSRNVAPDQVMALEEVPPLQYCNKSYDLFLKEMGRSPS